MVEHYAVNVEDREVRRFYKNGDQTKSRNHRPAKEAAAKSGGFQRTSMAALQPVSKRTFSFS